MSDKNKNTGYYNSGNSNSGNYNSGDSNSGYYNSGNRNSGYFNTDEPTVRMFNKDTGRTHSELDIPYFVLKLTEWVYKDQMTHQQKIDDPDFHIKGGTLIKRSYKEAWAKYWNTEASEADKQAFLNLPNFDAAIFKEITGIDVEAKEEICEGKVVEIDGKKYRLKEVK